MKIKYILCIIILFYSFSIFSENIKKDESENKKNEELSTNKQENKIISIIEFSHFLPLKYISGANRPGFSYGFNFTYTLPFSIKPMIFSKSKFIVNFSNATGIMMDKVGLQLRLVPIVFLEFEAGYYTQFSWTISENMGGSLEKGESIDDISGEPVSDIGYNIDLGAAIKFSFPMFFPKVKFVIINKSTFDYWFYPNLNYWKNKQLDIMLEDSWIFTNNTMLMWREKYFAPYLMFNINHYFIRADQFTLFLGGGCNFNIPKANIFINACSGVYLLSPLFNKKVEIKIFFSHTFSTINFYKKKKQIEK